VYLQTAALRVCLLMLDITLGSGQPGKTAVSLLHFLFRVFNYRDFCVGFGRMTGLLSIRLEIFWNGIIMSRCHSV
jgi:hypothetical protein